VPLDFAALLRRFAPERRTVQLRLRPDSELVEAAPGSARTVLLDTNVYIDSLKGKLPAGATALLDSALRFHCSVCIGELAVGLANQNQATEINGPPRAHFTQMFGAVPKGRLLTPSPDLWAGAGLVAGTLARTQGYQPHQRRAMLNDTLIYLTALQQGVPVLTSNKGDFDLIQQVVGRGSFFYYDLIPA
jgi:predicted nucleic acid-binding protein